MPVSLSTLFLFFNDTATTEIYTLSLHDALPILRSIVGMAHVLGLDVVAEGVETAEQDARLRAIGCSFGQGWLYGRPELLADVVALLDRRAERIPVLRG